LDRAPQAESALHLEIQPQPDDTTCGPTCLHAVYRYFGEEPSLAEVVDSVRVLEDGGTLGVFLASHALRRGYEAKIFTYNLQVFDPSWFSGDRSRLEDGLRRQLEHKRDPKLREATAAYLDFLARGGEIRLEDLNPALLRRYLKQGVPILTGLSATYLYRARREYQDEPDDARGSPVGHFVVLCGYSPETRQVRVADPYPTEGAPDGGHYYEVAIDRLVGAILLGIVTYDANLVVIRPQRERYEPHAQPRRRQ